MSSLIKTLRTVSVAGFVALGITAFTGTPSSAHQSYVQCDDDGDDCWQVICDDDGDDCRAVRHFNPRAYAPPPPWGWGWSSPTYGYAYPGWGWGEEDEGQPQGFFGFGWHN